MRRSEAASGLASSRPQDAGDPLVSLGGTPRIGHVVHEYRSRSKANSSRSMSLMVSRSLNPFER